MLSMTFREDRLKPMIGENREKSFSLFLYPNQERYIVYTNVKVHRRT